MSPHEAAVCIERRTHDGLAPNIERCVHNKRTAGDRIELGDHVVVKRRALARYRLNARRVVEMSDRWNVGTWNVEKLDSPLLLNLRNRQAPLFFHRRNYEHVRRFTLEIEVFRCSIFENARGKWPKPFAKFDLEIDQRLHACVARISDYAARAESTGTE